MKSKTITGIILRRIAVWLLIAVFTIVVVVGLRILFFATFSIPSNSMAPAIVPGDKVVVNKWVPGPRIIKKILSYREGEEIKMTRLRGKAINRNDILVFNSPDFGRHGTSVDLSTCYAKRCVAIPGDTFYIKNARYYVNNDTAILGNYDSQLQLHYTPSESIAPYVFNCFPYNKAYNWNIKDFGPLYIPGARETLTIDTLNIILYQNLIMYETRKAIQVKEGRVLLNDSIITRYVFKNNYYFMAGDQVLDSKDSRYWGLLPEDHIIGKVAFIFTSRNINDGRMRWGRCLRKVK